MAIVYAWPPVGATSQGWHVEDPVAMSRSLMTGARLASRHLPRRRVVSLTVGGALFGGYMQALQRLVRGGERLVRLRSRPLIWAPTRQHGTEPLAWFSEGDPMGWTTWVETMAWWTGELYEGSIAEVDGFPALQVTGLPPETRVIRVGEFVTVYGASGFETRMALRDTVSDDGGVATIVVDEAFTISGMASLASTETAVFEPVGIPAPARAVGEEWFYDWSFREVFAGEVGGFQELNPW